MKKSEATYASAGISGESGKKSKQSIYVISSVHCTCKERIETCTVHYLVYEPRVAAFDASLMCRLLKRPLDASSIYLARCDISNFAKAYAINSEILSLHYNEGSTRNTLPELHLKL